jgi:GNAT superfamily N-acetyltransferase
MEITLKPVISSRERRDFVTFPWQIYRRDPCWVPPLISEKLDRLDPDKNPFWRTAEQALWIAYVDGRPSGTIAGIIDHHSLETTHQPVGQFGFFECINDAQVAGQMLDAVAEWARMKGMAALRGPFNPSPSDEVGILVEGFETRPAILEAHTPPYYPALIEGAGFHKFNDSLARLVIRGQSDRLEDLLPEKLRRVAAQASQRPDLVIRPIRIDDWDGEIQLACQIYNAALACLPDYTPISEAEFARFAESIRPFLDPRMALLAEANCQPVGFALALPDMNEALQHVNGRLDLPGMVKLWWYSRKLSRVSFKVLMILPEYQGRGLEAVLIERISHAIWDLGYKEIDMSLTGEENVKSLRLQENLGFKVYRRYRVYEKAL